MLAQGGLDGLSCFNGEELSVMVGLSTITSHHMLNLPVSKEPWRLIRLIKLVCSFVLYNVTHCGVGMQVSAVIQPCKSSNTDRL